MQLSPLRATLAVASLAASAVADDPAILPDDVTWCLREFADLRREIKRLSFVEAL
jgi:hypothetical protein